LIEVPINVSKKEEREAEDNVLGGKVSSERPGACLDQTDSISDSGKNRRGSGRPSFQDRRQECLGSKAGGSGRRNDDRGAGSKSRGRWKDRKKHWENPRPPGKACELPSVKGKVECFSSSSSGGEVRSDIGGGGRRLKGYDYERRSPDEESSRSSHDRKRERRSKTAEKIPADGSSGVEVEPVMGVASLRLCGETTRENAEVKEKSSRGRNQERRGRSGGGCKVEVRESQQRGKRYYSREQESSKSGKLGEESATGNFKCRMPLEGKDS